MYRGRTASCHGLLPWASTRPIRAPTARTSRAAVLGMVVEAPTYITDTNANSTHIERREMGSITTRHSAYALTGARGMGGGRGEKLASGLDRWCIRSTCVRGRRDQAGKPGHRRSSSGSRRRSRRGSRKKRRRAPTRNLFLKLSKLGVAFFET